MPSVTKGSSFCEKQRGLITPERRGIGIAVGDQPEGYSIPEILLVYPEDCEYVTIKETNLTFCKLREKFASRQSIFYAISRNNKLYTLTLSIEGGRQREGYYLPEDEIRDELNIFNQMLSTFKFFE